MSHTGHPRFLRMFAVISFLCIGLLCAISGWLLTNFIATHMLQRDAQVTMQFVQSILSALHPPLSSNSGEEHGDYAAFFDHQRSLQDSSLFITFFQRLSLMHEVVRTNVYAPDGMRIWSTNPEQVGIRNLANSKLVKALGGELAVSKDIIIWEPNSLERRRFSPQAQFFAEMYMPMLNPLGDTVVGVVEVYKVSDELFRTILRGQYLVWGGAIGAGLCLYGVLLGILYRAAQVVRQQREQIIETETFAAVGGVVESVAQGIHRLLSVMHTSGKAIVEATSSPRQAMEEIISAVDRLESWIRNLLAYMRSSPTTPPKDLLELPDDPGLKNSG